MFWIGFAGALSATFLEGFIFGLHRGELSRRPALLMILWACAIVACLDLMLRHGAPTVPLLGVPSWIFGVHR